jgi:ribosomal protein L25 (general stress protein Ctc)
MVPGFTEVNVCALLYPFDEVLVTNGAVVVIWIDVDDTKKILVMVDG